MHVNGRNYEFLLIFIYKVNLFNLLEYNQYVYVVFYTSISKLWMFLLRDKILLKSPSFKTFYIFYYFNTLGLHKNRCNSLIYKDINR